jgi:ubiquinone/menaquinone biosynthesis C-methylase UbiE
MNKTGVRVLPLVRRRQFLAVPDNSYSDLELASLYDLFYPWESRDDLPFYLPMVMAAPTVLDVGCGTGALLKAARRAGHPGRLCGLDPAVGMLEQARDCEDVEWVLGDISNTGFRNEFDLAVMTGHAFQVLVSDEEIHSVLSAIRCALNEGGVFAFETRNPTARERQHWTEERVEGVTDESGTTVLMRHHFEAAEGDRVTYTTTYWSSSWHEEKISRSTLRFLEAGSLLRRLNDAGLRIVEQFGDWDRRPLGEDSPEIITLVRPG